MEFAESVDWLRKRRRARVRLRPFRQEWLEILARNVPYYERLSTDEQEQLRGLILIFLDEKGFEGANGLPITDEMRVTVAAQACLLLLGRPDELFPRLRTIILYPLAYVSEERWTAPEGIEFEQSEARAGESWANGALLLSWEDVLEGASDPSDGVNLVLHEFAHQLDEETGEANGLPYLPDPEMYPVWEEVFTRAYDRLIEALEQGQGVAPLEPYAAESPAEFFAVITELFFERPRALRAYDSEIYNQLRGYYRQDPGSREGEALSKG